jgi:dipeptidase
MKKMPPSYSRGSLGKFDWNSAWWAFNFVSNYINLKYSFMIVDVQKEQKNLETLAFARQDSIETTAAEIYKTDKNAAIQTLEDYSITTAENVVLQWQNLGKMLLVKYIDGYIHDEKGSGQSVGYPQDWYNRVVKDKESLKIPVWEKKEKSSEPKSY